jgi:hypothetical protein
MRIIMTTFGNIIKVRYTVVLNWGLYNILSRKRHSMYNGLAIHQPLAGELDRLPEIDPIRSGHRLDLYRAPLLALLFCLPPPVSDQQQHPDKDDKDDG